MSEHVYVIRNQRGQYWAKAGEWIDGREPQRVLRLRHHDEAINQLVELSARDIDLRGEVLPCELNAKGEPAVEASQYLTPTTAERAAAARAAEAAAAAGQQQLDDSEETAAEAGDDSAGTEPALDRAL